MAPTIESIKTVASTKWLALQQIQYVDEKGNGRIWDRVIRTTTRGDIDCVAIVCILTGHESKKKTILVKQYRPAIGSYVIEFPAGLIDDGEDAATAALRELKEETGYVGKVTSVSPKMYLSPGIGNESQVCVIVSVDTASEQNKNPTPCEEDEGHVETIIAPIDSLLEIINQQAQLGVSIHDAVYFTALGLMNLEGSAGT